MITDACVPYANVTPPNTNPAKIIIAQSVLDKITKFSAHQLFRICGTVVPRKYAHPFWALI